MAIFETPKLMQPAYNEVVFETNGETFTINANVSGGNYDKITLEGVKINGRAVYDVSSIMQAYFFDRKEQHNELDWIFTDRKLFAVYSVSGVRRSVINAVQKKGQTLDLLQDGASCLLTLRPRSEGKVKIPVYPGYPSGVCVAYRSAYENTAQFNITPENMNMSPGSTQILRITSNTEWKLITRKGFYVSEDEGFGDKDIILKATPEATTGVAIEAKYGNVGSSTLNIDIN